MEQQAPNQTIGTGTLEVKPQMQAVHDEIAKIDAAIDALQEKAGRIFENLIPALQQASDLIDKIAAGAVESQADAGDGLRPESPEAYRELSRVQEAQTNRELLTEVQGIRGDIAILIARTVED